MQLALCSNGDSSPVKELMAETVLLYDVEREESATAESKRDSKSESSKPSDDSQLEKVARHKTENLERLEATAMSPAEEPKEGTITCNSTEMVREKVSSSNGKSLLTLCMYTSV